MGRCVHEADEKWGGESKGADEKWGGESVTPARYAGKRLSKPSLNVYCRAKIDVLIGRQTSRAHRCDTPTVTSRKVVLLLPSAREI